jgi:type II secretory pathway predicted ATPase ExeA
MFSVHHALECKKGGLVISRHNEIRAELVDLTCRALTPSAVRDKPKIYTSRPAVELRTSDQNPVIRNLHKHQEEERGGVLICGLWKKGTDAIIDVRITDLYAKSNIPRSPMKVLEGHEREKKRKYLESCLEQVAASRRLSSPPMVSLERRQRPC